MRSHESPSHCLKSGYFFVRAFRNLLDFTDGRLNQDLKNKEMKLYKGDTYTCCLLCELRTLFWAHVKYKTKTNPGKSFARLIKNVPQITENDAASFVQI